MANSDKNIVITPNVGNTADPTITFRAANTTVGPQTISLNVYPTSNGTLSFEGSAGQLFSVTNSLTGTLFSVNDVSGIPSIEVIDSGLVKLAQYAGNVVIGSGIDDGVTKLQLTGSAKASGTVTANAFVGPLTGSVTASTDGGLVNQHNGSATNWYGRILSKNSTSDKAAFLGTYGSIAGVFAHNNALTAWTDLYVNTVDGAAGGAVRMPSTTYINGSQAIHAGNYNSYSPTLTGTGASGTWGINVTGNAATATNSSQLGGTDAMYYVKGNGVADLGRKTTTFSTSSTAGLSSGFYDASSVAGLPSASWYHLIVNAHNNSSTSNQYEFHIATGFWDQSNFYMRSISPGSVGVWRKLLHDGNYNSFSPTLTGTGASGSWGISITGNAATATNAGTATALATARTLTIGATGKTFDGSANVSWSRAEIETPRGTSTADLGAEAAETAIGYVANPLFGQPGGALYTQVYSTVWKHQIQGDYYTGQIAVRGKNNGTWQAWRTVLDSTNYNSYAPTLTGTGASGSWGISITGNAATATSAGTASNISNAGTVTLASATESNAITITAPTYSTDKPVKLLNFDWYGNTFSLGNIRSGATPSNGFGVYYTASGGAIAEIARFGVGGTFNVVGAITQAGNQVLHAGNYNSYSPTLTGTGASGSWGISVTGSAASVSGTTTAAIGSAALGSGTADSTTYLRGDRTWATVSAGATITNDTTTNATRYLVWEDATSGTATSIGVSSTKLYFNPSTGIVSATGFTSLSDATKKTNVQPIKAAQETVQQLNGVTFDWVDGSGSSYGFIAQEIEKVLPHAVVTSAEGVKSVNYSAVVPFLVEAVKDQRAVIASQEARIARLEEMISKLIT